MKLGLYQGHFPVAAIEANADKVLRVTQAAKQKGIELLCFPELALSGYPPEDLLFQEDFKNRIQVVFEQLCQKLPSDIAITLGMPWYANGLIYNALVAVEAGRVLYVYYKRELPNFGVFDERRYFTPGEKAGVFQYRGQRIGLAICEDLWQASTLNVLEQESLDCLLSVHASPFEVGKQQQRLAVAEAAHVQLKVPILYVHQVGVQDELIFDGGSFYLTNLDQVETWPEFEEGLFVCGASDTVSVATQVLSKKDSELAEVYCALCFALKGYVEHHHFPGILVGLSGGVDSALVLAVAVDALGPERVEAVLMPSEYTASMSLEDARAEAEVLGVAYHTVSIESLFESFLKEVSPYFIRTEWDLTEENIQARLRGMILMALSNKSGKMVVSTTNKSELAVGYGTLYGDMAGGFALLKDVYKTKVYELVKYRNSLGLVIPERVITRAPSAELRADQTDQDSLPDYSMIDQVLALFVEENKSIVEIQAKVKNRAAVIQIIELIKRNEYKRNQAPIGPKISKRAFGKEWRLPIMS